MFFVVFVFHVWSLPLDCICLLSAKILVPLITLVTLRELKEYIHMDSAYSVKKRGELSALERLAASAT